MSLPDWALIAAGWSSALVAVKVPVFERYVVLMIFPFLSVISVESALISMEAEES